CGGPSQKHTVKRRSTPTERESRGARWRAGGGTENVERERSSDGDPIDDRLVVDDEIVRSLVVVPEHEHVLELQERAVFRLRVRPVERRFAGEYGVVIDRLAAVADLEQGVAVGQRVTELRGD